MLTFFLKASLLAQRVAIFFSKHRPILQPIIGALALMLGFWGWQLHEPPVDRNGLLLNIFRTFQLITLNFPNNIAADIPIQLQIARLLVPLMAALATINVIISSVTRPARLALLPYETGHIIVSGDDRMTESALLKLAERGQNVVSISPGLSATKRQSLEALGLNVVDADPLLPATLKAVSLKSASAIIITGGDDVANLNLAVRVIDASKERSADLPPLTVAVLINDDLLARELDLTLDTMARSTHVRYRRLSADREGLKQDLSRIEPVRLKAQKDRANHFLVIGIEKAWQQALLQLVISGQDHPVERPLVSLVLRDEEAELFASWRQIMPELDLVADFAVLRCDDGMTLPTQAAIATWREGRMAPTLAVILRSDSEALATALALRQRGEALVPGDRPILVHQDNEDHILGRLTQIVLTDRTIHSLVPFGGLIRAESIERILDRNSERTAMTLHARYLGNAGENASDAAARAWEELTENLREANRSAADHAPVYAALLGCRFRSAAPQQTPFLPSEADFERLAAIEHRRWMVDRIERGWQYGSKRNDRLRIHPDIVPYSDLSEPTRRKDVNAVKVLFEAMEQSGLVLVQDGTAGVDA